jgi:hypothetical protein
MLSFRDPRCLNIEKRSHERGRVRHRCIGEKARDLTSNYSNLSAEGYAMQAGLVLVLVLWKLSIKVRACMEGMRQRANREKCPDTKTIT